MEFETPQEDLVFNIAQSFTLDKDFFKGAPEIGITRVNLYFKKKPSSNNNQSGIQFPGVNVILCATTPEGLPDLTKLIKSGVARAEWGEIVPSADATTATSFDFAEPIEVDTGYNYAFLVQYDGDEDFAIWLSKEGEKLVGTNNKTAGPAGQYIGKYFEYNSDITDGTLASKLKPLNDTDAKFDVYCAKYSGFSNTVVTNTYTGQTTTVQTGTITITAPSDRYEYIIYRKEDSNNIEKLHGDDYVFQNTVFQQGTVQITANSNIVLGSNVNFSTLYDLTSDLPQYLVVYLNDDPEKYMVREILEIRSNTQMVIDIPSRHTNTAASFMVTPVGKLVLKDKSRSFGKAKDFIVLKQSNANVAVRFANNVIEDYTINTGGSGYANGDVLKVTGVTSFAMNAAATISTNSTGGITSLAFTNTGIGINSTPSYSFANSTGGSTSGTGANISFSTGMTLRSTKKDVIIGSATLINYDFHGNRWAGEVGKVSTNKFSVFHQWKYYHTGNTYDINVHSDKNSKLVRKLELNGLPTRKSPLAVSWSYRILQGSASNTEYHETEVKIIIESNSWFTVPKVNTADVYIYKNIINNDYTNEHTRYGNAYSKHVTTKINFDDDRFAEDLIVYLKAHRPANTDIKLYAKFHNSNDPEAFDDKDWTLLVCTSGANSYGATENSNDVFEYAYGLAANPNIEFISAGSVTTTVDNTTITGSGTTFNTDFAASDLVKIWNPLFPNNYMVSVINTVTNSTSMIIRHPVSNNNIVGNGFKLAKLEYPHQAFVYGLNDGVIRYYNNSMTEFDTYDTFALKAVLLSDNPAIVPTIDDTKAVGVSA